MQSLIYLISLLLTFLQIARDGLVIFWQMMVETFIWIIKNVKRHLPTILNKIAELLLVTLAGVVFLFNDGFIPPDGQHPRVLRLLIQRKISYQTAVVLDHFLGFTKNWDKEITEKVVWPEISLKVSRVKPFVNFNATECKLIMKDIFLND